MEPPRKRPRFHEPVESKPLTTYDSDGSSDLCDEESSFLYAEKDGVERGNDIGAIPDSQNELDQVRAGLDYKLKSTFEAIFEKYSKDFTGIGDEIDLCSGEIVVDNGHLLMMEDERDAGIPSNILLDAFTQEPERRLRSNETENDESDGTDHSYVAPEDMEEDDMIFFQDSRTAVRNPITPPPEPSLDSFSQQQADLNQIDPQAQYPHPSDSRQMVRFGKRVSPQIARYVLQQREQDNSNIETAWHTPNIPLATPGRPVLKSILINPDVDRSPSPNGSSVWAPSMPRGRRRRDGADLAAIFKGETTIRDRKWHPSGDFSTMVTQKTTKRVEPSRSKQKMSVTMKKKKANSAEATAAVSPSNRANPAYANTSYTATTVSDSEREFSDGASTSYYDTVHPHSDPETNCDYRWPRQPDQKKLSPHSLQVVSSEPSHLEHGPKRKRAPKAPHTQADGDATIECMENAQRLGFPLWSVKPWRILAEKNPRHGHLSWQSAHLGNGAIDSEGQTQPKEHAHMLTSQTYASNDDDNTMPTVCDSSQPRISSTILTANNLSGNVAYKLHFAPQGGLDINSQSVNSRPIKVPLSGALNLSTETDPGPSYRFSDEDEDGNHDDEELTNPETIYDDEPPSQLEAFQEQSSVQKNEVGEDSHSYTEVLEQQDTAMKRITPRRETSAHFEVVEELHSVQKKSVEVEPLVTVEPGEEHPTIRIGVIGQPVSSSFNISRTQTPCKIEVIEEQHCSPAGIFKGQPADVVGISNQHTSQDLQGLEGQASSSEKGSSTQSPARGVPDGLQYDIRTDSPKDQPHVRTSLTEEEDSTLVQATEKKTHTTLAEACTYEVQIRGSVLRENLMVNKPVSRKLLRPTRPSATLPKKSSPRTEQSKLQKINSSEIPSTPTSSRLKSCGQNLSSILGSDDFEELQPNRESFVKPALRVAIRGPGKKNNGNNLITVNNTKLNITHSPTPMSSTIRRGIRSSIGIRSANVGLASPVVRTPGGTIRRCGEKGFKCTKKFCFQCIRE